MNQLSRKYMVGLAVMSGLLLAASFPPVPTGITAFLGLVPFLFLMESMRSTWQAFRYSYMTFLIFNIFTIYWVTGYDMGKDPWLFAAGVAVILVHPLLFTIPGVLFYKVTRHLGQVVALATFPFIWTAYEWLAQLPSLSFPWLVLANSQTYDIDRIQFIQYTGALGASFWIVGINVLVYVLIVKMGLKHWDFRTPKFYLVAVALLLSVLLPASHGRYVLNQKSYHKTVNVGIIQPNIDPYEKWSSEPGARMKLLRTLLTAYEALGKRKELDLILLPETAIPFYILEQTYLPQKQLLQETVNRVGVPLLTGFPDIQYFTEDEAPAGARKLPGDSGLRYESYNSSMLVLPFSPQVQVYHKMKLTPMSERVPFIEIFPFLADALSWGVGISNWGVGQDTTVFTLPGKDYGRPIRTWAMICYETLYPEFVAQFVKRGSHFLAVITNDGWFGKTSGPYQLQRYTVLRAIENRRAIARCANNGVSCFIDPFGRVSQATELYTKTTLVGKVPLMQETTLYTRWGDWFARLCAFGTALLIITMFIYRKQKRL